jgi:SNF2 family DNA or RNA helicase
MRSYGEVSIADGYLVIQCQAHVAIKLQRVFKSATRLKAGVFQVTATTENAFDLDWFRQRYPMSVRNEDRAKFSELVTKYEDRMAAIDKINAADYVAPNFELAIPAREYQKVAAAMLVQSGRLLLADQLGVGKTASGICAMVHPGALPALVVTMTHLTRQWESEIKRFAPKLRVHRIRGGVPYEFQDIRTEVGPDKKRRVVRGPAMPDVVIINYHKLHGWADVLAGKIKLVIWDEAQELRKHESLKRSASLAVAEKADYRMMLTGSPVYNYGEEMHSLIEVMDPDALGDRLEFIHEWCAGPKNAVTDPGALGVYLRDNGLMLRRTRKDVGREIPALSVIRHVVDADADYLSREASTVAELARRVLSRSGPAVEQMRVAGELDWRLRQSTGISKAQPVIELVRMLLESEERVLLFGWHRAVYDQWCEALTKASTRYSMFTGEESDAGKAESVRRFKLPINHPDSSRVLMMSLRAGAGLDGLQYVCRTVVVGELDWSPMVHHQGIGRVHRDGQTDQVTAYFPVVEDGSDPVIEDVLGVKQMQADGIANPHETQAIPMPSPEEIESRMRKLAEDVLARARDRVGMRSV